MTSYVRLMRPPGFGPVLRGETVSIVGDAVSWVSLVWPTYELGGGVADVANPRRWYTGPIMVVGLTAGVLLDRFDRRHLLILDNTLRGLVMLSVPVAAALGVRAPAAQPRALRRR